MGCSFSGRGGMLLKAGSTMATGTSSAALSTCNATSSWGTTGGSDAGDSGASVSDASGAGGNIFVSGSRSLDVCTRFESAD